MNQQPQTPEFALKKRDEKPKDILAVLQSPSVREKVEKALPRHMRPDRMLRVMLTAVSSNPKLKACTQTSLLSCLMKCSQYGLEPDGRHAHLIPFKEECTLIFDYKGLVNIVRRSGEVKVIHADVVRENDEFEFHYGSGAHLRHKPSMKKDRGDIICAYSFVVMSTGEESFEVLPLEEILAVRDASQGYQSFKKGYSKSNPWDSNFGEMSKKTAFRRHSKWLPFSFELQEAISGDDETEEERFRKAKVVTPTDLEPSQLPEINGEATDVPTETAPSDAEPEPEKPAKESKRETKPAKAGDPRALLESQMTLEGVTFAEVLELLVRKRKDFKPVNTLQEVPDADVNWFLENAEVYFSQIRIDKKAQETGKPY